MSAPVGGGMFEVNIAEAPRAIRELETARRDLQAIRDEAQALGQVDPSARDEVSVDAAGAMARAAVGRPSSFTQALDEGVREIDQLIQALRSAFDSYRQNDESGGSSYPREP